MFLCQLIIKSFYALVETLNISVTVFPEISECLHNSDQILLALSVYHFQRLPQLIFIRLDCLLYEITPIRIGNILNVKLIPNFFATVLNVLSVRPQLSPDHFQIRVDDFQDGLVLLTLCKFSEVLFQFEEIPLVADQMYKTFHVVVCLFAEYEHSDVMVCSDVQKVGDVGRHEFEDEHDVISFVQVGFLVLLNSLVYFLFFLVLLDQLLHVHFWCRYYNFFYAFLSLKFYRILFPKNEFFIYFQILVFFVKVLVFFYINFRAQTIEHLHYLL